MMEYALRSTRPELMDDPEVPARELSEVYDDINRCNAVLGGFQLTMNAVLQLIKENPRESYTIVDVGCGEGEMLRKLSRHLRTAGVSARLKGIELRKDVLELAQERTGSESMISYAVQDLHDGSDAPIGDIVMCTLTLHHIPDGRLEVFLNRLSQIATIGVVCQDLQRSRIAYGLFRPLAAVLLRTAIARHDGLVSIKRGFTRQELLKHAERLPQMHHEVRWSLFRYVWTMRRKPALP